MVDKHNEFPLPIIGSTVTYAPGTNLRALLVDATGRLETTGGGGGGDAVHDAPDTYLGTKVGSHATASDRAPVAEDDYCDASSDLEGYLRVRDKAYSDVDGTVHVTVVSGGGGGEAIHDDPDTWDATKTGAHATAADRAPVAEDDFCDTSCDLEGYQRVRSRAYNDVDGTDHVTIVSGGSSAEHDEVDTWDATKVGGHANAADRADVGEDDFCDASMDLAGYQRVRSKAYIDADAADAAVVVDGFAVHHALDTHKAVKVSGRATAIPWTIDEGDNSDLSIDLDGYVRTASKAHDESTGTDFVTVISGGGGDAVHDDADTWDASKVGGHATASDRAAVAEDDYCDASMDLEGYLRSRDKAYDAATGANLVSPTITDADRYIDSVEWVDTSNHAAATVYYPSSNGVTMGPLDQLTLALEVTAGTVTLEATLDGSTWFDNTLTVLNMTTGTAGNATYVTDAMLDLDGWNVAAIRAKVVYPSEVNALTIWARMKRR